MTDANNQGGGAVIRPSAIPERCDAPSEFRLSSTGINPSVRYLCECHLSGAVRVYLDAYDFVTLSRIGYPNWPGRCDWEEGASDSREGVAEPAEGEEPSGDGTEAQSESEAAQTRLEEKCRMRSRMAALVAENQTLRRERDRLRAIMTGE